MSNNSTRNKQEYWICLFIFMLAISARVIPGARTIDDSFITYRYARNILSGEGFVYNPGEHVMGTTTPLYTLLLAAVGYLTGLDQVPFPEISLALNAIFDGLTCLLLYLLGKRLSFRLAGLSAALVWAIAPFSVTFAIGGLETSLYVLLLTGLIYTHVRGNHILTAGLAGLAFLTRPDALIMIVLVAIDRLIAIWRNWYTFKERQRIYRLLLLEASAFLIPILAWWSFAYPYFGNILPHSITAKTVAYRLSAEEGLVRLLQHYTTPFLGHETFGIPWIGVGIVLYPFLFLIGARKAFHKNPSILPFLLYPWLYFLLFAAANPLIFRWYLTPPLPAYILIILIGMQSLLSTLFKSTSQKTSSSDQNKHRTTNLTPSQILITCLVIIFPLLLTTNGWTLKPDHGLQRTAPKMAWYKLELLYYQAAQFLNTEMKDATEIPVLAGGDVGVLGYYTPSIILDTVGLNSPQSIAYYPLDSAYYVINYAVPPDLILDYQPDYVTLLEVYGRAGLFKEPRFWQEYELLKKIETDIYGSDGMLIFRKK